MEPGNDDETLRSSEKSDDVERVSSSTQPAHLYLGEDRVYQLAKEHPDSVEPVYVTWSENDPDHPRNWSRVKKWWITFLVCFANSMIASRSSAISTGSDAISETFHVSSEISTLALALYVLGLAIGPTFLAPLSEYFGRSPVYMWSFLILVIFHIPLGLAPNIATILVCQLITGTVAGSPIANTGGTISDLWSRNESGAAMALYGVSSILGPNTGPVISGYIVQELGFRWIFWIYMMIFGGILVLLIFTLPETRHPIILARKTKRLRKKMRKEGLKQAENLQDEKKGLHQLFGIALTRPFRFLFTEPITYCAAMYNGFVYGLIYLFNEAFPLVFGKGGHNFDTGQSGLTFIGFCIGPIIGAALHPLQERYYLRRVAENDGKGVPEARVWMARYGAFLFPTSMFWFAWTSYAYVPWIVPIIASVFFGLGEYIIILAVLAYVIDSYATYSASALAGTIFVRNIVGAGFPLFAKQMYQGLGLEWASSLLAFVSILLIPIPWLFFYKGEKIRFASPWARQHFDQEGDEAH